MSKKKHKLRAMTNEEFCQKWRKSHLYCKKNVEYRCPLFISKDCYYKVVNENKPCRINGKYILIEVKE